MKFLEFWTREAHRFKGIVFDIDGTLVCGPRQLPGAAELLGSVRAAGIPLCFLTNDGDHTMEEKCSFLCRAGLPARPDEFISCLAALDTAAEENDWRGRTFFAIGSLGTIRCLQLERDPGNIDHCAGVIMGEGRYDWRGSWEAAVNFFRRHPERPFIVPNPDLWHPSGTVGAADAGRLARKRHPRGEPIGHGLRAGAHRHHLEGAGARRPGRFPAAVRFRFDQLKLSGRIAAGSFSTKLCALSPFFFAAAAVY